MELNKDILVELVFEERDYSKTLAKLMKEHPSLVLSIEDILNTHHSEKIKAISTLAVELNKRVIDNCIVLDIVKNRFKVNKLYNSLEYGNETLNYIPVYLDLFPSNFNLIKEKLNDKLRLGYKCLYKDPLKVPSDWISR